MASYTQQNLSICIYLFLVIKAVVLVIAPTSSRVYSASLYSYASFWVFYIYIYIILSSFCYSSVYTYGAALLYITPRPNTSIFISLFSIYFMYKTFILLGGASPLNWKSRSTVSPSRSAAITNALTNCERNPRATVKPGFRPSNKPGKAHFVCRWRLRIARCPSYHALYIYIQYI